MLMRTMTIMMTLATDHPWSCQLLCYLLQVRSVNDAAEDDDNDFSLLSHYTDKISIILDDVKAMFDNLLLVINSL